MIYSAYYNGLSGLIERPAILAWLSAQSALTISTLNA